MKRTIVSLLLLALFALGLSVLAGCSDSGKTGGTTGSQTPGGTEESSGTSVRIEGSTFSPASLDVAVGETVTWTNEDSTMHTVTGDGGIESRNLAQGDSFSFTFDTAGTYSYSCSIHPSMTGGVIVR